MSALTTIKHRRGPSTGTGSWSTQVLAAGEIGVVLDPTDLGLNGKFKIGDGVKTWAALPYALSGLADLATSVAGGAAGTLLYQSAANTTATSLSIGGVGTVLNSTGSVPRWTLLDLNTTYFNANQTSTNIASLVTDETGSGSLVFANSPTLITPSVTNAGAIFKGTNTGSTTLYSPLTSTASYSVSLPASSGTLITSNDGDSRYLRSGAANTSVTGSIVSNAAITTTSSVTGGTVTSSGMTTSGIVANTSAGLFQSVSSVPIGNGGTGGTDVPTGRQGLRIYVQQYQPTGTAGNGFISGYVPATNDLWFW